MDTHSPLPPFMLGPSPIASSSRLTLDAFLYRDPQDLIASALSFAAEDELVAAAIAPPPTNKDTSHWIDPAAAYDALRQSSMFSHHLQQLIPRIRTLYANLRPSSMHQTLVSDLLLRNPDARALREILQEEADPVHPHAEGYRLRPGLVLQLYRTIAPSIRRRTVPRLSRAALLTVTRALRLENTTESPTMLSDLFYELAHTTNWEPEGIWPLLEIVLRMARSGQAVDALRLIQYPVQLGKLPLDAFGENSEEHPRAAELMIQMTAIRALLSWKFDNRSMTAANDLMNTMVESCPSTHAVELVLTTCRVAAISHTEEAIAWAGQTLLRMATDERFPRLSSANINVHLDALSTPQALQFYSLLPENHAPPSPQHILRLALAHPTRSLSRRLATDLSRTSSDVSAAIPGVLRALASARMLLLVRAAYAAWEARAAYIDSHTAVSLVEAFTRGSRTAKNTQFAYTVINDYLATTGKRVGPVEASITALHAYGLIGNPPKRSGVIEENIPDPVVEHVNILVRALGHSGALERLKWLTLDYPLLAHRLAEVGKAHGLVLPPAAVTIAASCAARHWGAMSAVTSLDLAADEEAYLGVLNAARKSRRSAMLLRFRTAVKAFPNSPMLAPTASATLQRLASMRAWDEGLEVLALALRDDTVQPASVFLSTLQREASGAVVDSAVHMAHEAAERVEEDAKEESATVEIFVDSVDGRPDAATFRAHKALLAARAAETAKVSHDAARVAWTARGAEVWNKTDEVEVMGQTLLHTMCEGLDAAISPAAPCVSPPSPAD